MRWAEGEPRYYKYVVTVTGCDDPGPIIMLGADSCSELAISTAAGAAAR